MVDDLVEQPLPSETRCPRCGEPPTEESVRQHKLSANGYLHDDVRLDCQECGGSWLLGIPIGEGGFDDLWCEACDDAYAFVHRFEPWEDDDGEECRRMHMKCPNCVTFWYNLRYPDENDLTLVGYPSITGTQDARVSPDGYPDGTLNTND